MVIGINCGHTRTGAGYGAVGIIKESEHTRLVGQALIELLRAADITVVDCTIDQAETQNEYLAAAVALANRQDLDWFISIHFNASASHEGHGVEVYTYEGRQYQDALDVCTNLAGLGFTNRGVKSGTGLYVIRKTKAKSMLIEVCFCDNEQDVALYNSLGYDKIASAIFNAVYDYVVPSPENPAAAEDHNMNHEQFIEFVGTIARKDWINRHLILPSLVIAQAIKEAAWGTSELAQNANALFGIKKNGWIGKTYFKDATEQNPDGTYRKDCNTEWRAYDSWEQSIIDHNDYLATRKIGNQTEPNWKDLIGCENYILAVQYLQGAQFPYATSLTYEESLVNDYIEKYGLTRFDEAEDNKQEEKPVEETAQDGTLFVVQVGAYKNLSGAEELRNRLESMGVVSIIKQYAQT